MVLVEDMLEAYYDCRRKKRNTASAIEYEMDYESKVLDLTRRINDRTYTPGKSICFIVTRPRYREVFAASFEDRIPHHYIYGRLNPLFEGIFGERIFNCREGKGQLYGVNMLKKDITECSENYTVDCWVMKLDLKAFFMSIDKKLLADAVDDFIVQNYVGDDKEDLRYLCRVIIMYDPEKNCIRKSPLRFWDYLPKEKSLFTNGEGKGIAIGNLFAQLFANFLLWFLEDVFTKHGIKCHGRYVDDIYSVSRDKQQLLDLVPDIRAKLAELGLRLNEKKFYLQHYAKGIIFIGAIVKPGRSYVISRTIENLRKGVMRLNAVAAAGIAFNPSAPQAEERVRSAVATINSYLGIMRHHNMYKVRREMLRMIDHQAFKEYVYIKGSYESVQIKKKYTIRYHTIEIIREEDKNCKRLLTAA